MSNSIGDLRNSGLQDNNFPWQLRMLRGLQCICDNTRDISYLQLLLPQQRRAIIIRSINDSGTNANDAFSISFASVGTAAAIVNGASLNPGETINFDAGTLNNFFVATFFNWDTTVNPGSELLITLITA
jgi:hypothetical protein